MNLRRPISRPKATTVSVKTIVHGVFADPIRFAVTAVAFARRASTVPKDDANVNPTAKVANADLTRYAVKVAVFARAVASVNKASVRKILEIKPKTAPDGNAGPIPCSVKVVANAWERTNVSPVSANVHRNAQAVNAEMMDAAKLVVTVPRVNSATILRVFAFRT